MIQGKNQQKYMNNVKFVKVNQDLQDILSILVMLNGSQGLSNFNYYFISRQQQIIYIQYLNNNLFMIQQSELDNIRLDKQQKILEQQRKFRNLESDRKYYAEETITFIKKQKVTIEKLKNQNQSLKELISKINNQKTTQALNTSVIKNTEQVMQELKQAINQEKQIQKQTDIHISNFQKKILEKKNHVGGYNAGAQSQNTLQKQIKILQNRLDKANQKFNQAIAVNKQLRSVIDSLRKERVIFDNLYKKLEKELHQKRKQMANIIEKANNAYQERDKANGQIQSLKQHAKKQAVDFQKQLKQLSQLMEKTKLASYIKQSEKQKDDNLQNIEIDKGFSRHTKNIKSIKQKMNVSQIQKIQKYRQDFAKIEAATQIQNFQELIRIFSQNQQKNFQMFKYVNLQSNEIEELESQVLELKTQLSKYQSTGSEEINKRIYAKELEDKYYSTEQKIAQFQQKYNKSYKILKSIANNIETIFNTIECQRQLAKEVAGSKSVSETNIIIFLGIIEQKVIKIIKAYKQISSKEQEMNDIINRTEKNVNLTKKINEVFTFDQFEDDEQQYDKILTHEDFLRKANETIIRQKNNREKKKDGIKKKK